MIICISDAFMANYLFFVSFVFCCCLPTFRFHFHWNWTPIWSKINSWNALLKNSSKSESDGGDTTISTTTNNNSTHIDKEDNFKQRLFINMATRRKRKVRYCWRSRVVVESCYAVANKSQNMRSTTRDNLKWKEDWIQKDAIEKMKIRNFLMEEKKMKFFIFFFLFFYLFKIKKKVCV